MPAARTAASSHTHLRPAAASPRTRLPHRLPTPPAVARAAAHRSPANQPAPQQNLDSQDRSQAPRRTPQRVPARRRFPPPTMLAGLSRYQATRQHSSDTATSTTTTDHAASESHNPERRGTRLWHQLNIVERQRIRIETLHPKEIHGEKVCIKRVNTQAEGLPDSRRRRHRK